MAGFICTDRGESNEHNCAYPRNQTYAIFIDIRDISMVAKHLKNLSQVQVKQSLSFFTNGLESLLPHE